MAEGNLQAVHAVNRGVAGRRAAQGRHQGIRNKTHMHQMILDRLRQIEGDQDSTFTNGQFTQYAHPPDSVVPTATPGRHKNTTGMVGFKYTAKMPWAAINVFRDFGLEHSHVLTFRKRSHLPGAPQLLPSPLVDPLLNSSERWFFSSSGDFF